MRRSDTQLQTGYTLIELLLYVVIVGALLTSVVFFFGTSVDSRVKNQSIAEVNDQGATLMDTITQTIHNATSITTPTSGTSAGSLTLVVPTGSLSPTIFDLNNPVLGYNQDGGITDTSNSNNMNATKFVASASGTVTTLYAYIGPTVAASPNNKAQMAIYSGTSNPTALLASSSSVDLTASSWNAFPISSVSLTSGQTYWLAYNTNGLAIPDNDLRYHAGTTGQSIYTARTFGTWPASWTGTSAQNFEYSVYTTIDTGAGTTALRIKEGSGSAVNLTDSHVQVSGLNFQNLTRSGTSGLVQVTFTLSRVNPNNKNEYSYSETFTTSAEVGW